ncbi:ankyrin-3 [Nephila pilipes]|uniref:Ankyrin-3 n=1 Tax=Nephila pilipes TaxID=299642 RepID=A0A8X6MDV1_NEPPI|nr:ankyrin-3 [Nephila pilipes]
MINLKSLIDFFPVRLIQRFFRYTQKDFTFSSKTYDQLVLEFNNLGDESGKYFYIHILTEIKISVSTDNVENFKTLTKLLNFINCSKSCEIVEYYQLSSCEYVGNINLIILACKSGAVKILEYLFSNENIFFNLPFVEDKSALLPYQEDEECHNAFYYAIRSNIIPVLQILTDKWPNSYFVGRSEEMDDILSKAYKELILKNVPLAKTIEICVKEKLVDLRFFHKKSTENKNIENSENHLKQRIELVQENISFIMEQFWESEPNEQFLLLAKFIGKNIHILKSLLKSTYDKLPWEEIEFCLIIFTRSCLNHFKSDIFYNLVLNKQSILVHLENFSKSLDSVKEDLKDKDFNALSKPLRKLKREDAIQVVIKKNSEFSFEKLYSDFTLVRDFYSLQTIRRYIDLAVSADSSTNEGQLLITRVLQVIGENFKNTLDSPKLSDVTIGLLLSTLPSNTKRIITDLRNALSKSDSLCVRFEIEKSSHTFFSNLQADIVKMNSVVVEILCRNKGKMLQVVLNKVIECENFSKIKEFLMKNHISKSTLQKELIKVKTQNIGEAAQFEKLISKLEFAINSEFKYAKSIFDQIKTMILGRSALDLTEPPEVVADSIRSILPLSTKEISTYLKNCLLRTETLSSRSGIEDNTSFSFNAKLDITKINKIINDIFDRNKLMLIRSVLNQSFDVDLTEFLSKYFNTPASEFSSITEETKLFSSKEIKQFEKLISDLETIMNNEFSYEKELLHKIRNRIQKEKSIFKNIQEDFNDYLRSFLYILSLNEKNHSNLYTRRLINIIKRKYSFFKSKSNLESISDQLELLTERLCTGNRPYVANIALEIFDFFEFSVGKVKWVKNFRDMLCRNKKHSSQKSRSVINKFDEDMKNQLVYKLSLLKNILSDHLLGERSVENLAAFENDFKLQSLIEMLVLDIMSVLGCLPNHLTHNLFFLDSDYPIAYGKNLRNHLAHGNALIDVFLGDDFINVILIAKKIAMESMQIADSQIGKKVMVDVVKIKESHQKDLSLIKEQHKLFIALVDGKINRVKNCISKGADIRGRDLHYWSSLHFAAKGSDLEVVKFVLTFGLDINAKDINLQTALHVAATYGRTNIVKYFLEEMNMMVDNRDISGKTSLHIASYYGHEDVVKALLEHGANISCKDIFGFTPLHCAVIECNFDVAYILLGKETDVDSNQTFYGFTALQLAAGNGQLNLINALLERNANVKFKSDLHFTPLHFAACGGHLETVKSFVAKGIDVNAKNLDGFTALHGAVEIGAEAVVAILLEQGADVNALYLNIYTPLNLAIRNGSLEISELLLKNGAKIDYEMESGITSMQYAAICGDRDLIELLLKYKADSNVEEKVLILHTAAYKGHKNIMELLVEKEVDIHAKQINTDSTVLHLAADQGHLDIVDFLIASGIDIDVKDAEGKTALHLSSSKKHFKIVELLLKNKADIQAADKAGITPLHIMIGNRMTELLTAGKIDINFLKYDESPFLRLSASNGDLGFTKYCLEKGICVNAKCIYTGLTALHLAVIGNHEEVVNFLLDNKADINAEDNNGSTSIVLSIMGNKKNIVNILVNRGAKLDAVKERELLRIALLRGEDEILEYMLSCTTIKDMINTQLDDCPPFLHEAVMFGHMSVIGKLLKSGIKINAKKKVFETDEDLKTALYIAAELDYCEIAYFLLSEGADPNITSTNGLTALHVAAVNGSSEMVQILCNAGANDLITGGSGLSAIELALQRNHFEVVKIMLQNLGENITDRKRKASILLHEAALRGSLEIIKYLVDNGADVNTKNHAGAKPVHIAAAKGYKDIVEYFLSSDIKVDDLGLNGWTLLHYASSEDQSEMCKFCIEKGANVNVTDNQGSTPLHVAAKMGKLNSLHILLSCGAYYNARNQNNETPLQIAKHNVFRITGSLSCISDLFAAVKRNNSSATEFILRIGMDFSKYGYANVKDAKNNSLLHYVAWKGFEKIVVILFQFKANPNIQTTNGATPLHYASKFSFLKIVKTLLQNGAIFDSLCNANKTPLEYATDREVVRFLKFIKVMFTRIQTGDVSILQELRNVTDMDTTKAVMNAKNREGRTLITVATICNHPKVEELKLLYQNDVFIHFEMAEIFYGEKDYEQSLKEYKKILQWRIEFFGENNVGVTDIKEKMALILFHQKDFNEALKIQQHVYEERKKDLGDCHEKTLAAESKMGLILKFKGQKQMAMDIFEKVSKKQREVLGLRDINTLATLTNMAQLLFEENQLGKALKVYKEILDKINKCFEVGELTLGVQTNIAKILNKQGDHYEALKILENVLETKKKMYGMSNRGTLRAFYDVAATLFLMNKEKESLETFREVLDMQNSLLGTKDADTLNTRNCIGNILFSQKKFYEAFQIYAEDFESRKCIFGADNFEIIRTQKRMDYIASNLSFRQPYCESIKEVFKCTYFEKSSRMTFIPFNELSLDMPFDIDSEQLPVVQTATLVRRQFFPH